MLNHGVMVMVSGVMELNVSWLNVFSHFKVCTICF